jgi:hypothetical protein
MKRVVLLAAFFLCPTAQAQVSVGVTVPLPVYVPQSAPAVAIQAAPPALGAAARRALPWRRVDSGLLALGWDAVRVGPRNLVGAEVWLRLGPGALEGNPLGLEVETREVATRLTRSD